MALPTISQLKERVRSALNTPLSPRMAQVSNSLGSSYQRVTQPINNFLSGINTHPLSSRIDNPVGKLAAGIVETPYTALTSVPKTYGQTLNEINSGNIFSQQGAQRTAGRFATSALDTMSGGLLKRGVGAIGEARKAVSSVKPQALKTLITTGAKSGLKTGVGYGAGYGFGSSMEKNGGTGDVVSEMLKQGALGGLIGGVLGGGIPALSGGIKALKSSPELRQNAFSQIGDAMPPIGLSIKNVGKEPKIDDFPLLSGRTPIAGVNDTRPSAIKAARVPVGKQELNVNNLDLSQEQKMEVAAITGGKKKSTMTNKSVIEDAQSLGADMSAPTINQTRETTARQLNTRRQVVSLEKEFDDIRLRGATDDAVLEQLRKIDESGTASQAQGSDIARQMNARRILADEMKTPMQRVFMLLREAGVDKEKYLRKAVKVDFKNPNEVNKFYRSLVPPKFSEWIDVVRYNSMLSSPLTQLVNVSSNLTGAPFVRPVIKAITGGVDFIGTALGGGQRKQFAGEGPAYVKGYWKNIGKGWSDLVDVMAGRGDMNTIDNQHIPVATGPVTGFIENKLSFPSRLLEGMDRFFMAMGEGGEKAALQYRKSKGVNVANIDGEAQKQAAKTVFRGELMEDGQGHMNDFWGYLGTKILEARDSKYPVARFFSKYTAPFVSTPTNIFRQGLEYTPGVGLLNLPGNTNKSEVIAKQIFGATVFMGAAGLFSSGRSTWGEPTNQKQKEEFRAAGMQPYSVKIGDTWYAYNKLHPAIAFPIAFVAAIEDYKEKKSLTDDDADAAMKIAAKLGQFLFDQSYMKSFGTFMDIFKGGEQSMANIASNYGQQLVPFRAFGGWITRMLDTAQRKVDPDASFIEKQVQLLKMNVPWLVDDVPTRNNQFGAPLQAQNPILNAFSPIRTSTENPEMRDFYDTHQEILRSNRENEQIKESLNRGGKIDSTRQSSMGSVIGDVKEINGQFYAKLGKRGYVAYDSEEEAQQAINRDKFETSGKPVEVIDGMVYRRGKNGKSLPPVLLTDYEERVYNAQLTQAKDTNDFQSWILTARDRYRNLNEQLNDPTLDDLDKLEVQNKINGLVKQAALYSRYGGFKKPKSSKGKKIKFKTSFKPSTSKSIGTTKPIKPAPFKPLNFSAPSIEVKPYKLK